MVRDEPDEFFSDHCPPATDLEKALRDMQAALEILKGHLVDDVDGVCLDFWLVSSAKGLHILNSTSIRSYYP
jgi:hypothetical protein